MVTLSNRRQNGNFDYTSEAASATGFFEADAEGNLQNLNASYADGLGSANVYANGSQPQYNISGTSLAGMITIAQTIATIWQGVGSALAAAHDAAPGEGE